ncbi:hypothetical protein [Malacoplasma penetrans]|nr:hypothetical protein [Malacoplasma penetrans]
MPESFTGSMKEKDFISIIKGCKTVNVKNLTKIFETYVDEQNGDVFDTIGVKCYMEFTTIKKRPKPSIDLPPIVPTDDVREMLKILITEVRGIKEEIVVIKEDIKTLKEDVAVLKEDVSKIKRCPTIARELAELD